MSFEIIPAHDVPFAEQASISNRAFAGYVGGWTELNPETLARFLVLQGADLFYSRFVRGPEGIVGFGYINRTGKVLRLAGMGIVPEARGSGAAAQLLEQLFAEAEARGDKTMMLEVIEQNPRAHALYRRHGFREITRLLSWRREAFPDTHGSPPLEEISIVDAIQIPGAREYPELPWQISRHAVVKGLRPQAFRVGAACVVISDPEAPPIRLQGLWSKTNAWEQLQAAVARVLDHFHESEFLAGAVWPEDFGVHVLEPLGFKQEPISQFLLRRDF